MAFRVSMAGVVLYARRLPKSILLLATNRFILGYVAVGCAAAVVPRHVVTCRDMPWHAAALVRA